MNEQVGINAEKRTLTPSHPRAFPAAQRTVPRVPTTKATVSIVARVPLVEAPSYVYFAEA